MVTAHKQKTQAILTDHLGLCSFRKLLPSQSNLSIRPLPAPVNGILQKLYTMRPNREDFGLRAALSMPVG